MVPEGVRTNDALLLTLSIILCVCLCRYRASLHATFLVKSSELNKTRAPAATLVPCRVVPPYPESLAGCAPWIPNAVASIVFPSGKLEAPAPPGSDVVTVYVRVAL